MDCDNTLNWLNRGVRYAAATGLMAIFAAVWMLAHLPAYWLLAVFSFGYGILGMIVAHSLSRLAASERQQQRLHRIVT